MAPYSTLISEISNNSIDEIYADDLHMHVNDVIELVLDKKTSKLTVKINGSHQHTFTDPKLKNTGG